MSSKKSIIELEKCPICNTTDSVGFLSGSATKKYFCSNCFHEINVKYTKKGKQVSVFDINANGTIQDK